IRSSHPVFSQPFIRERNLLLYTERQISFLCDKGPFHAVRFSPKNNRKTPQTHCIIIIAGAVTRFPAPVMMIIMMVPLWCLYCPDDSTTPRIFVEILS
ncbi:hypothetical protein IscW_ISCW004254, partial [Ixodes scapularis]